jgi:hypothetical protein
MSETESVTPNVMPGATPPPEPAAATEAAPEATTDGLSTEDRAELARLRDLHKDEQKWRREATKNFADAQKLRNLIEQVGGDSKESEFDPQKEFQRLRDEVAQERTARVREAVARTEEVDPDVLIGDTEEQMRESAARYKAKVDAAVQKAIKGRAPAAAPTGDVSGNDKVAGAKQITSQDELKRMSSKDVVAAYKEGNLDALMGKT